MRYLLIDVLLFVFLLVFTIPGQSKADTSPLEKLSTYDKPIKFKKWTGRKPILEIMFPAFQFTPSQAIDHANRLKRIGFTALRLGSLTDRDDTNVRPETYHSLIKWGKANNILIGGYNPGSWWSDDDRPEHPYMIDDEGNPFDGRKYDSPLKQCFADSYVVRGKIGGIERILKKFGFDRLDLFDEVCWPGAWAGPDMPWVCYAHKDKFISYLKSYKLKPSDFDKRWNSWDDLVMPTRKNWQNNSAERKLYFAFRRWKEDVFFDYLYAVCKTIKKRYPNLKINAGIMTPCGIMNGCRCCVPMVRFRELDADSVDYDTYYFLSGRNRCALWNEEVNEFIIDITGLPLELTKYLKNPSDSDKNIDAYSLWPITSLLLNDNVIGVNYYYYNRPYKKIRITVPHRRFDALSRSLAYIKKTYQLVHSIPEKHFILVVTEDPIHRGLFKREYYLGYSIWRTIQKLLLDADFAIPRMLKQIKLDKYGVIVVEAKHISEENLKILLNCRKKKNIIVLRTLNSCKYDDFHIERPKRAKLLKKIPIIPNSLLEFQKMLVAKLQALPYIPLSISESIDLDVRYNGNRYIIVSTNDSGESSSIKFMLRKKGRVNINQIITFKPTKCKKIDVVEIKYYKNKPVFHLTLPLYSITVLDAYIN